MNLLIINAIKNRQRLTFMYNGKQRVVEPQCYGIGTRGTQLLRVNIVSKAGSQVEPLFNVSKIEDLKTTGEVFTSPGPNYKKGDSAMKKIFAEL